MWDVRLFLVRVEVLELLARELGMAREVEVAAVGDPLELRPTHREQVLDVGGRRGVVRELVGPVLAEAQVVRADAEVGMPAHLVLDPALMPVLGIRAGDEELDLHHLELAGPEDEVAGVISLRKALPICAIPNGGFLRAN